LNTKLESLSDLKLDTAGIETAISTGSASVVSALGKDLSVKVSNIPLDVKVSNFPTTTTAEVQPGGADVTALAESIKAVTGIQESQTTQLTDHEGRITANLTADGNQDKAIEALQDDVKSIDPEVIRTQITAETAAAKESINQTVTERLIAADGKVVANTALINTVKTTADKAKTTADGFAEDIKTASDNAITAKDTATDAKKVADATKLVADAATVTATNAQGAAQTATDAIATINATVERNRNTIESRVKTVEGNVKTNKDGVKTNLDAIGQLRSDTANATTVAQNANSRANSR
jgi:hypothetical protein